MITPLKSESDVQVIGIESSMNFMIDQAATAHVLNMLRSGIYKDPKMACIREYICNARDSVIQAGKDLSKNVIISLPNQFSPNFKIRDEGVGLSETDFKRIFRKYGASTKRDTNEQVGCLGIGCKSAFSYTDTFTITAIKNGIKCVFVASVAKNSTDTDGIGSLNKIFEAETAEPNGVEISIPVKESDFYSFCDKTAWFLKFIPVNERPIVNGRQIEIGEYKSDYFGNNWKLIPGHVSYVVMGGVPYLLSDTDDFTDDEKKFINYGVILNCNIGEIEVAISREEIRYTPYSVKAIKEKLAVVQKEFSLIVAKNFENCSNIWEVKNKFYSISKNFHSKYHGKSLLEGLKFVWRGREIDNDSFYGNVLIEHYRSNGVAIKRMVFSRINAGNEGAIPVFLINDCSNTGKISRIKNALAEKNTNYCYLLTFNSEQDKQNFYAKYDFATLSPLALSSFERSKISRTKREGCFILDKTTKTFTSKVFSDADKGVFVEAMQKNGRILFRIGTKKFDAEKLCEMIAKIESYGIDVGNVWGFKPKVITCLNQQKWTRFEDFVKEKVGSYLKQNNATNFDCDANKFREINSSSGINFAHYSNVWEKVSNKLKGGFFKQYFEERKRIENRLSGSNPYKDLVAIYTYFIQINFAGSISKDIEDFAKMTSNIVAKYPMLKLCEEYNIQCGNGIDIVVDYIKEVDSKP